MIFLSQSNYCLVCKKVYKLQDKKLGREQIAGGERIFLVCPDCGTEFEMLFANEGEDGAQ